MGWLDGWGGFCIDRFDHSIDMTTSDFGSGQEMMKCD